LRDAVQPAQAVRSQAKGLYRQIDEATGGKFQPNADALANVNVKLRNITGTDEELKLATAERAQIPPEERETPAIPQLDGLSAKERWKALKAAGAPAGERFKALMEALGEVRGV